MDFAPGPAATAVAIIEPPILQRLTAAVVAFLTLLGVGAGCKRTESAATATREPQIVRALAGLPLRISVPASAAVRIHTNGVCIEEKPGARSTPDLCITHLKDPVPNPGNKTRLFRAGLRLQYELSIPEGQGSGGDEQTLSGIVEVDGQRFKVACHDQNEWPAVPDAEWCLPWMSTLQAAPH